MQSGPLSDGRLPVFVFPNTVNFYLGDKSLHKQVLTLYNPYEFPIRFKVLCTAPNKYTVVDSEGSIKAKHCIDIVIRHNEVSSANCNVSDKFRFQMVDQTTKQVIGRKDIVATLFSGLPPDDRSTPDRDSFETLPSGTFSGHETKQLQYSMVRRDSQAVRGGSPNIVILFTAIVCIVALLLPDEGEQSTIPFQLSTNLKLVFAYVLGLVTMAIIKP